MLLLKKVNSLDEEDIEVDSEAAVADVVEEDLEVVEEVVALEVDVVVAEVVSVDVVEEEKEEDPLDSIPLNNNNPLHNEE